MGLVHGVYDAKAEGFLPGGVSIHNCMSAHGPDLATYNRATAFVAEALRSGINTVPKGQAEAARAIGLDFTTSLSNVVLPQAFRGAIAPLVFTALLATFDTWLLVAVYVAIACVVTLTGLYLGRDPEVDEVDQAPSSTLSVDSR